MLSAGGWLWREGGGGGENGGGSGCGGVHCTVGGGGVRDGGCDNPKFLNALFDILIIMFSS